MGITPLFNAARNGHLQVCKLIIGNVFDKNPRINDRTTPLHVAAMNGHFEVCKLIMANVVDKNPINMVGMTPQAYAHQYFNNFNHWFF